MNNVTAQTVIHDLVANSITGSTVVDATGQWTIRATSPTGPILVGTIQTFATNHGVTATTNEAIFT